MKRYVLLCVAVALLASSLTSCLREASVAVPDTQATEIMTDETTESLPETTEPDIIVTDPVEIEPHAEVVKWTARHEDPAKVIMTASEIEAENLRMLNDSPALVDILDFVEYMSADEIKNLINDGDKPSLPRYDKDGSEIGEAHLQNVGSNMAMERISELNEVLRGIVVSRTNVRAIPDDKPYRKAKDNPYDSIQRTELCVGTPVWVIHTSLDGEYLFVRAYNYSGWVRSTDVAFTRDDALWRSFAAPDEFVCITDTLLTLSGEFVDMGATFPLVSEAANGYTVLVPKRDAKGQLVTSEAVVQKNQGCIGYMPYTYENFLTQAFKYEGTMYGWGGLDNGVDCSSFVANVFRSFGFKFPRDTKDQNTVVGSATDVNHLKHDAVSDVLGQHSTPTAVYYPGHTLLYLGFNESDRRHYFIHAPQIGERVSVTSKKDLSGITYVCHVGVDD